MKIIDFDHADLAYGKDIVLRDVSLKFEKGDLVGIVGPSGSGKTTLLKSLLGLTNISSGKVAVGGEIISGDPPPGIGYVPQLETVDWNFPVTVEQIVMMGLHNQGTLFPWPTVREKKAVKKILIELNMSEYCQRHISELSGGQKQRVFLARALVGNPSILLLDEPTNGIDVKTRHTLLHLLKDLNKNGMTILITTHDLNAVAAHLPKLICFNKKLIATGSPKEVFTPGILSRTYDAPLKVIRHTGVIGSLPFVAEEDNLN